MCELDPFENPADVSDRLLTLSCGHTFTIETLDGQLGLIACYEKSEDGRWSQLRALDSEFFNPPTCLTCRRPIKAKFANRYGRPIKRARLDMSEKATIANASDVLSKANEQLLALPSLSTTGLELEISTDKKFPGILQTQSKLLSKQKEMLLKTADIFDLAAHGFAPMSSKQWAGIATPLRQLYDNLFACAARRSPETEAYEAAITKLYPHFRESLLHQPVRKPEEFVCRQARMAMGSPPPKADVTRAIQASWLAHDLLLRLVDLVDRHDIPATSSSKGRWTAYTLFLLNATVKSAELTAEACISSTLHGKAVASWARYVRATLQLVKCESRADLASKGKKITPTSRDKVADKHESTLRLAFGRYTEAVVCYTGGLAGGDSTTEVVLEAEAAVEKMREESKEVVQSIRTGTFYQPVGLEEQRMAIKAMGFGATGHWFRCRNGHPFAIGDCGGAMEISRCPECGESIGGTDHRLLDNVEVDDGLENLAVETGVRREQYMWGGRN